MIEACQMTEASSFLRELDEAVSRGTPESRARALWHTTDVMITGSYSDDEIWTFGAVIGRLADEIEVAARAQLARRLARFDRAPVNVIHKLALSRERLHQEPDAYARDLGTEIDRGNGYRCARDEGQQGSRELGSTQQWRAVFGFRLLAHDQAGRRRLHPGRTPSPAGAHPPPHLPAVDRKGVR